MGGCRQVLGCGCLIGLSECFEGSTNARIQNARSRLNVRRKCVGKFRRRTDHLLAVRHAKGLVENRLEYNLAAPPVVIVLPPLSPHEVPPVVNLALTTDHRDTAATRDSD